MGFIAFVPGDIYSPIKSFTTRDSDDIDVPFERGSRWKCVGNKNSEGRWDNGSKKLVDQSTGEVVSLSNHVAYHPEWYFTRNGKDSYVRTTQNQYIVALVNAYPHYDADELWNIAVSEKFGPLDHPFVDRNGLCRALSAAVSKEMIDMYEPDGSLAVGIDKTRKNCTYAPRHLRQKEKKSA